MPIPRRVVRVLGRRPVPGRSIRSGPQLAVAAGTLEVFPDVVRLTLTPLTPTLAFGAVTLHPDIVTLTLSPLTGQVNAGMVPRLRLRAVRPRYHVYLNAVADGLGG